MKKTILCCSLFVAALSFTNKAEAITWKTNYQEAMKESQSSSKPVLLFFTGSDWCGWCKKLEQESLETTEFADEAGNAFIFVQLDFPMNKPQNPTLANQNKELQEKFQVKSFPTLILLDKKGDTLGMTGYRPGGGKNYADHLLKMLENHKASHPEGNN